MTFPKTKIWRCHFFVVPLQPFLKITTHHINALRSSCEPRGHKHLYVYQYD
jgi:hypothetical protein